MYKLILVDDERFALDILESYIQSQFSQFEVCGCFFNGQQALDYLLKHPVDIVITDIRMPRMDGLSLAKEIHLYMPDCIVILLSGYSEFEYARQALRYNVFHYALKPLDFQELDSLLKECVFQIEKRYASHITADLSQEQTEMFFYDLCTGGIYSPVELSTRLENIGISLWPGNSFGSLIKVTVMQLPKHMDHEHLQLRYIIKNILQFLIPDTSFYFFKKNDKEYHYVVLGTSLESNMLQQAEYTFMEYLILEVKIEVYRNFGAFEELLSENTDNQTFSPELSLQNKEVILKAIDYIHKNYMNNISLEEIANKMYISSAHFAYLFKLQTGSNYSAYLTDIRMKVAIELLRSDLSIDDIAKKVGYSTRNRFIINFRRYTSLTPTEYRKQILAMENLNI